MALSVDIRKKLGSFELNVAFENDGSILALLGASGCGKSMTLKCIAGIETPDSGRIVLNGRTLFDSQKRIDLSPQQRRVGYLFQQYALFPNMTVEQNIVTGVREGDKTYKKRLAADMIAALRLEGMEKKHPQQLSGGQQQRVALARILLNKPELLLLDEPFSALDSYLKWQLELELSDTLSAFGKDVIYVSHDRDEVYGLCSKVCVLTKCRSEPVCQVEELFRRPRSVSAALLSGCKNISRAERSDDGRVVCLDWGVSLLAKDGVENFNCVGLPAEALRPASEPDENSFRCVVRRKTEDIASSIIMLESPGGGLLRMELPKESLHETPEAITVSVAPENLMLLSDENHDFIKENSYGGLQ